MYITILKSIGKIVFSKGSLIALCTLGASALLFFSGKFLYDTGYEASDKHWTDLNNEKVRELNAKIEKLEGDSKQAKEELRLEKETTSIKLGEILSSIPKIQILNAKTNKVLECEDSPIEVKMDSAFTEAWNKLNEQAQ